MPATLGVNNISKVVQFFDHDKSSSISKLIEVRSRDLQKLLKYFNGTTTSVSDVLLLAGVLPIIFVLIQTIYLLFSYYVFYY